jgi:hypothetical protein
VGYVVISVDLFLTGGARRGSRSKRAKSAATDAKAPGRRAARAAEEATAVRPEPRRTQALL